MIIIRSLATWQAAHDAARRAIPVLIKKGQLDAAAFLARRADQMALITGRQKMWENMLPEMKGECHTNY